MPLSLSININLADMVVVKARHTSTINHLLAPIVDELITLDQGIMINTFQHPNGRMVRVRLLALSGDLPATKKVAGFASATATQFCSMCHVKNNQLARLEIGPIREKNETLASAKRSKEAESANAQDTILRDTGVRWSELNRLTYWDPSKHVVLGIMHNWLEGVLQAHWRYRWKFVAQNQSKQPKRTQPRNQPSRKRRRRGMDMNSTATSSGSTDADTEDTDMVLGGGVEGGHFSQEDITQFRQAMINVVLPSGLARLPTNLGEERHGKLKAAQWYSLFAYIIPLVIFDLYLEDIENINTQSNRAKFIMNTAYLMQCTHVLFAREITAAKINRFESNYKKYSDSVASLFGDVKVQPNHHCSLHIPDQIRAWGPLPRVAEFAGERLIGFLQKIKTNSLIDKMNGTMMRRGCQLQRLMDKPAYKVMIQQEPTKGRSYDKKKIKLTDQMYGEIYNYLVKTDPSVIHREATGRRREERVAHGSAIPLRSIQCDGFKVATTKPDNCVVAMIEGKVRYGIVKQLYQLEDRHHEGKKVIVLSPIANLFPRKFNIPTSRFRYYLYLYKCVVGRVDYNKALIVSPSDVVSLAAYRFVPSGTFGIKKDGLMLVPYDHQALLDISDNS
ncbi:hypothetical protein VP01_1828g6 [Puccinia sorghi]|uniref:Uncharacterized protein n=1 Tax=Puccinia sorghi TaxID=27349 RepID=A0A0L6VDX6_9BASI|nr:hypothetical protein VP01_1828g6 [Puccinia sorghi]